MFGILNFGHCDLFGICYLLFEFLISEIRDLHFLATFCSILLDKCLVGSAIWDPIMIRNRG